jgi:hypothetical protein
MYSYISIKNLLEDSAVLISQRPYVENIERPYSKRITKLPLHLTYSFTKISRQLQKYTKSSATI